MAKEELDKVRDRLDLIHVLHYFDSVVELYENRTIARYIMTEMDAERLRILLKKVRQSL